MVNKSKLIREYAKLHRVTMKYAKEIFDTVFALIGDHLVNNSDDIYIHKFGVLKHKITKEHYVKHPSTGELVLVEAKDKISFIPSVSWNEEDLDEDFDDDEFLGD